MVSLNRVPSGVRQEDWFWQRQKRKHVAYTQQDTFVPIRSSFSFLFFFCFCFTEMWETTTAAASKMTLILYESFSLPTYNSDFLLPTINFRYCTSFVRYEMGWMRVCFYWMTLSKGVTKDWGWKGLGATINPFEWSNFKTAEITMDFVSVEREASLGGVLAKSNAFQLKSLITFSD